MENKGLHMVAFLLLIIGGLNWLLVGLFQWDIGAIFGGQTSVIARIVYVLVGLSAIVIITTHKKDCKTCEMKPGEVKQKT
jgi:uncharacterized membrane protein YuzA (DUF378 family)